MIAITGRFSRTTLWLVVCLLLFALLVALANPLHDFPMGDDWEYANTVLKLITTGQFYRSPVLQPSAFFPALWGALFSWLLGFSFTTLRLSTLPLAAGTLAIFYLILGEFGFAPVRRVLGTLTLMVAPLFVFNALSFMTDVPFLFWVVASMWCSLRAFRLGRVSWLLAGSACAALAFLTRQLGLALTPAAALLVLVYRPRADWPRWLAASVVLPAAAAALFFAYETVSGHSTWADAAVTGAGTLQFIFSPDLPLAVASRVVMMLVSVNMYLLPLWLAFGRQGRRARAAFGRLNGWLRAGAALLAVFAAGSVTYFGARGQWWPYSQGSLTNAGLWPSLAFYAYPNDVRPPFLPLPVWAAFTYLGAALAVVYVLSVIAALAGRVRDFPTPLHFGGRVTALVSKEGGSKAVATPGRADEWLRWARAVSPARAVIYLSSLALLSLVLVYPVFFERYFLPFMPAAIILLLDVTGGLRPSLVLAGVALVLAGIFSVGLMRDYFDWHAARWEGSQALVAVGLPLEKLDAGYDWSGWFLADEAYDYMSANEIPVTRDPFQYVIDPEYMVTFTEQPGYQVAQEWPFYSPFRQGGADHLLLLERLPAPAEAAAP